MTGLAAFAGWLAVGGGLLAAQSWQPVPIVERSSRRFWRWSESSSRRSTIAGIAFLVALFTTRWPVAAIAAAIVGWIASGSIGRRTQEESIRRTEALALWAEMLRDAIGTARGVEGVLVATAATAPLPIRDQVQPLVSRLERQSLDEALDELADELDHPLGDLIVMALRLTSTAGGRQVREVLGNLGDAAYAESEATRRIEVARERPRAAMRYTAIVIGVFVVLLVVFSSEYLEPYESSIGLVVLLFVSAYWTAGLWWMTRMSRSQPVERFLAPADYIGGTR